jgi:hypothetical protein
MVDEAEEGPDKLFEVELFFVFVLATEFEAELLDGVAVEVVEVEVFVVLIEQVAV